MPLIRWMDLAADSPYPGIARRRVDGREFSAVHYRFEGAARFPMHHHAEEQFVYVAGGRIRMTNGDEILVVEAGESVWTPPGIPHSITADTEGAVFLNVIVPRRMGQITLLGS